MFLKSLIIAGSALVATSAFAQYSQTPRDTQGTQMEMNQGATAPGPRTFEPGYRDDMSGPGNWQGPQGRMQSRDAGLPNSPVGGNTGGKSDQGTGGGDGR